MTGLRVAWNYSDNVIYSKSLYRNANFMNTSNFLSKYQSTEEFMSEVRDEKINSVLLDKENSNETNIYPNFTIDFKYSSK